MPPRRETRLPTTETELQAQISRAIVQHEALRSEHSGGTSGNNPPHGCTYKQFLDCKPLNFDETGGAVAFVTYISGLFLDGALSWWNLQVQTLGEEAAYAMSWEEMKELMRKKYCSRAEIQKLETEFWNHKMDGPKIAEYVQRFHDLSRVVPYMVEPEFKVRKFESCGKVGHSKESCWAGTGRGNGGQREYGNGNNNRSGNGYGNRNQGGNGGNGNRGNFGNQAGNVNRGANNNQGGNGNGNGWRPGCFNCGDVGHFKRECPKLNQAQGRVFNIGAREAR
ncbi:keratin, type I cytoskeletal 9-like [Helianthus annuus]|uniref:keratin, type I cytoskeletal 9-like n=1 Tax=Helianthus annuus TaxID=4232 RepID=UPI000B904AFB|nr:keratin, type I cytoskeletal 9-like [Helianthus annuus]